MRKWIRYDEVSNGHRIYWPDKHSVTVEHSIKFSNDEVILLSIPVAQPIQGELAVGETTKNQPDNSKSEMEEHTTKDKELTDNYKQPENPVQAQMNIQVLLEQPTTSRSCQIKKPARYIREIQSGTATADNRPGRPNLPAGIQMPELILEIQEEREDKGQLEHAMAAAISEIKAIGPQSLNEAMGRPDHPKWEIAIQEELITLEKAKTWSIIERLKEHNVIKNKWVFRIKKDAAGKVEQYKMRLIAKGFTQVFGVDYYNT